MTIATDLDTITHRARSNSARWFPELHARPARDQLTHLTLGLTGEAGEVANLVKKLNRRPDDTADLAGLELDLVAEELANVLTYLLNIAGLLGIDLAASFHHKQAICEQRWGAGS